MRIAAAVIAAAWVLLVVGDKIFAGESAGRAEWRKNYHRPAEIPFPKSNPYSDAKVKLGKMLFFDPILSGSNVRSCATCHNPGLSWGDGRGLALGEGQKPLPLRSPTLLNVAWVPKLGWDGHFRNLEAVAMGPIAGATNMNLPE
ncbi:MAG TPA: cytochrome-c peroxidase, partial [Tepidisphaeraceae bacterium]|nr:cytochrome-c peroxidase [Tepidisphaeraceae bacterium]